MELLKNLTDQSNLNSKRILLKYRDITISFFIYFIFTVVFIHLAKDNYFVQIIAGLTFLVILVLYVLCSINMYKLVLNITERFSTLEERNNQNSETATIISRHYDKLKVKHQSLASLNQYLHIIIMELFNSSQINSTQVTNTVNYINNTISQPARSKQIIIDKIQAQNAKLKSSNDDFVNKLNELEKKIDNTVEKSLEDDLKSTTFEGAPEKVGVEKTNIDNIN